MRTSWSSRLRALLLAVLFIGGGTALPVADGLAYHLSGRSFDVPHVEASTTTCHGERCLLDLAAASVGLAATIAQPPRVEPFLLDGARPLPTDLRPTLQSDRQPPPRAPPLA
jgi:hypothetical protein